MILDGPILLHVASLTDVGLQREHNEDVLAIADLTAAAQVNAREVTTIPIGKKGVILVVCDGMGGAAAGEVAAKMATEMVCQDMSDAETIEGDEGAVRLWFAKQLRAAAWRANQEILETARLDSSKGGMGTTMTAVGVIGTNLVVAQVGDSRAYLWRDGRLAQLSRDQSLLNDLLDNGQITSEEAENFEQSNVILQALGVQEEVEVLLSTVELRRGDRLLVCSDGLSGVASDDDIASCMAGGSDSAEVCRELVDLACQSGGPDNISTIVAIFDGAGFMQPQASDAPVGYVRWYVDEPETAATPETRSASSTRSTVRDMPVIKEETKPDKQLYRSTHTLFLLLMLLALAVGGMIWAYLVFRSEGGLI